MPDNRTATDQQQRALHASIIDDNHVGDAGDLVLNT
jgi:hypothetical protein